MVDFRKWLLAFAGGALLVGMGSSTAYAQGGFTCNANAGTPTLVRVEGVAEEVGDLILNCTGGTPTPGGQSIPLQNVQISMNTNVTSRIVGTVSGLSISEALILIDEPFPTNPVPASQTASANQPLAQQACLAINNTNCAITSIGVGIGPAGSYSGVTSVTTGKHYNVFQGYQNSTSTITWNGVPIDAPGTAGTRIIRITNIRANACLLGGSSTLVPTQIYELIGISGSQTITINNPNQIVAESETSLISTSGTTRVYTQCTNVNTYLLTPAGTVTTDSGIAVSAKENFAAAFKPQTYGQVLSARAGTYAGPNGTTRSLQNVPAFSYNTESGFIPDPAIGTAGGTFVDPSGIVGLATQGTQISFGLAGIGAGVSLFAPSYIYLTGAYGAGSPVGVAVLAGQTAPAVVFAPATGTNGAAAAVTVSGTTASLVYEIYYADPQVLESLSVPVSVAYLSNTASNLPAFGTATSSVGYAPLSTTPTASSTAPIPRFCQNQTPTNLFTINACTCNLLFPFVTNQGGFDTGIAIANTTADTLNGVTNQQGNVTLTYYGGTTGGGAAPATAVTTSKVGAGQELVLTVSNGGNFGIPATPGFQGYIIAQAQFQFCHGFAFISDVGAQKLAEGYLAIQLDVAGGLQRTGVPGENDGH